MAEAKKPIEVTLVAVHTVGLGGKFIAPGTTFSAIKATADELIAAGAAATPASTPAPAEQPSE